MPAATAFGGQGGTRPVWRVLARVVARWHLLSLDAPTVATVWMIFVAHSAALVLPWVEPAAMFVAVWMIYAADRLLDGQRGEELEQRHRFHLAHRRGFLAAIAAAAAALLYLLPRIDPRALRLDVLLATLLAVWMLLIHAGARGSSRLPKEVAVGLFFPAAVFIPTVARMPWLRAPLLPLAALLAGVCALNCLLLYAWEHPTPRKDAHWTTRWASRHLDLIALALLLCAAALAFVQRGGPALACALSVALLWALHRGRRRFSAITLRSAADVVLLTPLLWARW